MEELADEAEALRTNVANLNALSQSLGTFNEAFASYLFVMEMNGLTTDWPQARCVSILQSVY
jgi:DASH complex subunit DAM1